MLYFNFEALPKLGLRKGLATKKVENINSTIAQQSVRREDTVHPSIL